MTAVFEDPGTHGEGGLHGAGLVPVGVRTPGGAGQVMKYQIELRPSDDLP